MADKETTTPENKPDEWNPNADEALILANLEEVKGMIQSLMGQVKLLLRKIG